MTRTEKIAALLAIGAAVIYFAWNSIVGLWRGTVSKYSGTPEMTQVKNNLALPNKIDLDTCKTYAENAGFSGDGEDTILAIAQAESGLNPNATLDNKDASGNVTSTDRGILQINTHWHPEVSDEQAFNPVTAFQAAFTISKGGTDFHEWVTYQTGAYKKYLSNGGVA